MTAQPQSVDAPCPKCEVKTPRKHCPSKTCTWFVCSACKVSFHPGTQQTIPVMGIQ